MTRTNAAGATDVAAHDGPGQPLVAFLTDFGLEDAYVGVVKGVMLGVCANLAIVDLTHAVPAQDVWEGAFQLMTAVISFPPGTIFLAVVDPGVGTNRRAIALRLAEQTFVGPDNGLLSLALVRLARQHGLHPTIVDDRLQVAPPLAAVQLVEPGYWRHPVSATFHARDVFGPVAAHLASGVPLEALGPAILDIAALPFPSPSLTSGRIDGEIIHVDRFGNLITNVPAERLGTSVVVRTGKTVIRGLQATYGAGRDPVALIGSAGLLEIAVPLGNAARLLGLSRGDTVRIEQD